MATYNSSIPRGTLIGSLAWAPTSTSHNPNPPITIEGTGLVNYELNLEPGTYTLTGADLTLLRTYILNLEPGVYTLTGFFVSNAKDYELNLEPGVYTLTGSDTTPSVGRFLNLEPGTYTLTGFFVDNTPSITSLAVRDGHMQRAYVAGEILQSTQVMDELLSAFVSDEILEEI